MIPLARYENRYLIHPDGFIWNLATNTKLKPSVNPNGYLKISLANGDGTHNQELLHILVAKHFIPNPYGHPTVNHEDGIKENCHVDNLTWASYTEQMDHALRTGLRPGYMSADDKEAYLLRVLNGEQVSDIASQIGRRPETLHKMLRERAKAIGVHHAWVKKMKENRCATAIHNLKKIKARNS